MAVNVLTDPSNPTGSTVPVVVKVQGNPNVAGPTRLSPAGVAAVGAALSSYVSGLSAANLAAMAASDSRVGNPGAGVSIHVSQTGASCVAANGADAATVSATLAGLVATAANLA